MSPPQHCRFSAALGRSCFFSDPPIPPPYSGDIGEEEQQAPFQPRYRALPPDEAVRLGPRTGRRARQISPDSHHYHLHATSVTTLSQFVNSQNDKSYSRSPLQGGEVFLYPFDRWGCRFKSVRRSACSRCLCSPPTLWEVPLIICCGPQGPEWEDWVAAEIGLLELFMVTPLPWPVYQLVGVWPITKRLWIRLPARAHA